MKRLLEWLLAAALIAAASAALGAPVDTVTVNLNPLIDIAAKQRNRFSVEVPHLVRLDRSGSWHQSGGTATWSYSVHIPAAVSLSFYANRITLPRDAVLTVRGKKAKYVYTSRDVKRSILWSRIAVGDVLVLQLSVPVAERSATALEIRSFQAGYRGFGAGVPDHPHYAQLRARALAAGTSSCVQNYECGVTAGNSGPGQATVALIIANAYQCSGTLLNDVPGDGTPFVLTARHCENGQEGGGNPGAASAVRVLWNAISPCGQALGTLYDPGILAQDAATTIVEQQDAWLIELAESPVVADAYYAGFDASGGVIVGGYTIHHALSNDKQLTKWYGQARAVQMTAAELGVGFDSNFWEAVNQTGNIGPGASGSAFMDPNNRVVGSLSYGRKTDDASGYGSCPATPLAAPNGNNGAGDFTSLAAVWSSTADSTSSTGTRTLQQALDPQSTGLLVVSGKSGGTPLHFTTTQLYPPIGTTALLSWSAPSASGCTASGGVAGDNWNSAGSLLTAGTIPVSESRTGAVTYFLSCSFPDGTISSAKNTVTWMEPIPQANLIISPNTWVTRPATAQWFSNVGPCSLDGGSTALRNLPSSGSAPVVESVAGTYTYTLKCGTGLNVASSQGIAVFTAPAVTLHANGTDRLIGSEFHLVLTAYSDSCTPTGGAPDDGWATTQFVGAQYSTPFDPVVTAAGTYTYGVVCRSGPVSASASVTVTFENGAPYARLTASKTSVTNVGSFILTWKSNGDYCNPSVDKSFNPGFNSAPWGISPEGSAVQYPQDAGTYTLTYTCSATGYTGISASVTITVSDVPPTAALSASPTTFEAGRSTTVTWSSTNAESCSGGGGYFAGMLSGTQGSQVITFTGAGTFPLTLICGRSNGESATSSVTVTVTNPKTSGGTAPPPSGGGGGGGAFGVEWLGVLGLGLIRRRVRQPRDYTRTPH